MASVKEIGAKMKWDAASTERLRSAGEETLVSLLQPGDAFREGEAPLLIVVARAEKGAVEMEYLAVIDEENLEDRLAYLDEQTETFDERELSFRLLRH